MRTTLKLLLTVAAAASLTLVVGCDDGASGDDDATGGTGGGASGGATGGGAQPTGGTAGGDQPGGSAGGGVAEGGATGGGAEGGSGGGTAEGGSGGGAVAGNPGDPLAVQNDWGPAGRVNYLAIPASAEEAGTAGCGLVGARNGTGLNDLVSIAAPNGLVEFVQPDDQGEITMVVFGQVADWEDETTVADVGRSDVNLLLGSQGDGGEWLIDPASFNNGNAEEGALISFADMSVSEAGRLTGDPSTFILSLPLEGLVLNLSLEQTNFSGQIYVDGPGFGLQNGILAGYLTEDSIVQLLEALQIACAADDPPSVCDMVGILLADPDNALDLLIGLLGTYDARVEGGSATECDPQQAGECNSIAVCLQANMEGIELAGLEPAE